MGLDRSFFSSINKPEQAYLFGALEAEGCVGKNKITLVLGQKELSWITALRDITGSRATIGRHWSNLGVAHRVEFCSKQWVEDLASLGFRMGKLPLLPRKLMQYYLKGLFDGDGTICWDKYNKCYISLFYGSGALMRAVEQQLKRYNIDVNKAKPGPTCWNVKMHRLATIQLSYCMPKGESYMLHRKCDMLQKADMINWLKKKERAQRHVELDHMEEHLFEGEE